MKKVTIKRKELKSIKIKNVLQVTLNNDVAATQELIAILIKKTL